MPIYKKYILEDLLLINSLYDGATGPNSAKTKVFYSKLAVIEVCGWVEQSLDAIAERASAGAVHTRTARNEKTEAVKRTYGFDYERNFIRMVSRLTGVHALDRMDAHLTSRGERHTLLSLLSTLKSERDSLAHTHVAGTTRTYTSPSVAISHAETLFPILRGLYSWACNERPLR